MIQADVKPCPVCMASEWASWPIISLLQCASCTLVVDPCLWKGETYTKEMERQFFEGTFVERIDAWQQLFEFLNNRRTWERLSYRLPPRATWLEIGVGSGSLLAYALKHGMRPAGCDPSKSVCEYVQRQYGIDMVCGGIESMDRSVAYDAVVMNHVLEHLSDPIETLKEVRARMSPTSWLHVAVPNISAWEARFPRWTAYEPYHLAYFNAASLRKAMERAGFRIAECLTVEPFSGWFLTIARTILYWQNGLASGCGDRPPAPRGLTRLLYRLLMISSGIATAPARWLQGRLGAGEELVVIAQPTSRS